MTRVYFVRHAQPEHDWKEDRTRPLTEEGKKDSEIVLEFLKDKKIDAFYCSPYKRSMDTIADAAAFFSKEIITDERLREREKVLMETTTECFRNAGLTMIIMKRVENPLLWFKIVT